MKKISAAFDGLKFSTGTMDYAIYLAAKSNAFLSGVFLDDITYHSYKIFDMVGSQGISKEKMKELIDNDKEKRLESAAYFTNGCKKAHVNYTVHHDMSFALPELLRESIYSDIVVVGTNETLSHFPEEQPTMFIRDLLSETQCPVLLVPNTYQDIEKVVLLYDGKPSSVFAIKMFSYMMPWLGAVSTEVVSVLDPKEDKKLPEDKLIKEFIKCNYPNAKYTLLHGDTVEECVNYLKGVKQNLLIVLGAYSRGMVSMWFKTSMADVLMKEMSMPLFIAHNK